MAGENRAGQGRREAAYTSGMWPTEDTGMRRFAAGAVVCVFTGAGTSAPRLSGRPPPPGKVRLRSCITCRPALTARDRLKGQKGIWWLSA